MTRFLLLLLAIVGGLALAISLIFRMLKSLFGGNQSVGGRAKKNKDEEIVYKKDNIVVLKGEAGKANNDGKE